ncbi:MAG TPA: hypothetical protein VFT95_20000 [Micromonosporaceae bacterium]|nr:hypothetical protein [Micromonosporaceae bacterium]
MTADRATTAPQAPPRSRERRLAPVFALLFLAPWAAECSWGGFTLADTPFVVVILAPLYGAAAVLIREVARRTGGGWPAIALLAAAFGVYQAGLVDQALFNDAYLDDTQFADWSAAARATEVPLLGFNAEQAVAFIGNHIVLTICAPIAIVESFLGRERRHRPWLGVPGLIAVGVLLLLGSLMVFTDDGGRKGLMATPLQLSFAAVTVLALIAVAMLPRWRRRDRRVAGPATRKAPRAVWVGLVALGAHVAGSLMSGWGGVVLRLAAAVVAAAVIVTWSRRTAWEQPHVLAAWSAGLVSAAAFAYLTPTYEPSGPVAALVGDIAVSVVALTLVTSAFWKLRHEARRSQQP